VTTFWRRAGDLADEDLHRALTDLAYRCADRMAQEGVPVGQVALRHFAQMRYAGQSYELEVDLPAPRDGQGVEEAVRRFHQTYERVYGQRHESRAVEFVALRVVASYMPPPPPPPAPPHAPDRAPAAVPRQAYVAGTRASTVPVHRREHLAPGQVLRGPAIVEQPDTTVVVPPGHVAHVDTHGNLILEPQGEP
jgi:N-methylhydantoinase A